MEQQEYERWMLVLIAVGVVLSVAEFLFISLIVGKGTVVGFQNGLLAGAGVVVAVVILVWLATFILKPDTASGPEAEETAEGSA